MESNHQFPIVSIVLYKEYNSEFYISVTCLRQVAGPGPGLYESVDVHRPRSASVNSIFKSKVPRFHGRHHVNTEHIVIAYIYRSAL